MARILVVDDEPHIVGVVSTYLAREGHEVSTAADGDTALAIIERERPDLVVLDVMLPKQSGFEVLRRIRASGSSTAVIMLTARDDLADRVAGLEIGADDYVAKPFQPRELVARVGAVLRRTTQSVVAQGQERRPDAPVPALYFDLAIDRAGREASRAGRQIQLTRVEFDVLATLVDNAGIVLSREQIGEAVFGEEFDAFDRSMDSHVKNIRRKLGARPDGGQYIETVRGVGYRAARH
jgi:DNA-binding response OmpR family regulator